jgi:hypothetical protein
MTTYALKRLSDGAIVDNGYHRVEIAEAVAKRKWLDEGGDPVNGDWTEHFDIVNSTFGVTDDRFPREQSTEGPHAIHRYARANGGHLWHLLPLGSKTAVCGHTPRNSSRGSQKRAGWLTRPDGACPDNGRACEKCLVKPHRRRSR